MKITQINPRIIGGIIAPENSWPFAVLIRQNYKTRFYFNAKLVTVR